MPVSNVNFMGEKDPLKKLQATSKQLESSNMDASFINDKTEKPTITRAYLEMIIGDYCQLTQNQQMFNKFLQIDTKLDKTLREYKAEIQMLLNSVLMMGMMNNQAQAVMPQMTTAPQPVQPVTTMQQPVQQPVTPQVEEPAEEEMPVKKSAPKNVGVE